MDKSRYFIVFLGLQTLLIMCLIWQSRSLQLQISDLKRIVETSETEPVRPNRAQPIYQSGQIELSSADLASLKVTIRDEIQSVLTDVIESENITAPENGSNATISSQEMTPSERQEVLKLEADIDSRINSLSSLGRVSRTDVDDVFEMIARLPPDRREDAVKTLNRAINQGQIDVRL